MVAIILPKYPSTQEYYSSSRKSLACLLSGLYINVYMQLILQTIVQVLILFRLSVVRDMKMLGLWAYLQMKYIYIYIYISYIS